MEKGSSRHDKPRSWTLPRCLTFVPWCEQTESCPGGASLMRRQGDAAVLDFSGLHLQDSCTPALVQVRPLCVCVARGWYTPADVAKGEVDPSYLLPCTEAAVSCEYLHSPWAMHCMAQADQRNGMCSFAWTLCWPSFRKEILESKKNDFSLILRVPFPFPTVLTYVEQYKSTLSWYSSIATVEDKPPARRKGCPAEWQPFQYQASGAVV